MRAEIAQSTKTRSARRPRQARERQLVEAAIHCISVLGMRDTTVPDVAARANMAAGSINQYFDSKELLFTAALRALSEEFETAWRKGLEEAGPDPASRLRRFVECYFQAAICQRKKIAVWFAFWGEARARPHYRAVCASYDQRHDETLEALCRTLIIQGGYPLAPSSAARIVGSLCHGLWLELLTGSNRLDRLALAELARTSLAALFPRHAQILSGPACAHAGIEGIRT